MSKYTVRIEAEFEFDTMFSEHHDWEMDWREFLSKWEDWLVDKTK